MTIQLNPEQEHQFSEIASASGKAPECIVMKVLQTYLRKRAELLARLEQARADVAAGRVFTSEEVWDRLQRHTLAS